MKNRPLVSIVIPTLNSEKTIDKCIVSIMNQSYENIEIIVVDAGSGDKTVKIADNFNIKVIEANVKSMTKQTNIGVRNSSGEYIYRIDSDVILPSTIVEESVLKCEMEDYDGVCVFWLPDDSISFWAKIRKVEKESYIERPNFVGSIKYDKNVLGARFLKRKVFDSVSGFDEEIPTSGEDYAFYNKLAQSHFNFATINSVERHIGEPRTLKDILIKNFRYGTNLMYFFDHQENGGKQFSPVGRIYLIVALKKALNMNILIFLGLITYLLSVYGSTSLGMVYYKLKVNLSGKK